MIDGHDFDIFVMLYGIDMWFQAASFMYHIHDSFSVIVLVLFAVQSSLFRLYGNAASPLLSLHDNVSVTLHFVHQLLNFQYGYHMIISHSGFVLSIRVTFSDVHVLLLPAVSLIVTEQELLLLVISH